MEPEPFSIEVPEDELSDLRTRLRRTRWPDEPDDIGWTYGTDPGYLHELVDYWVDAFDWRAQERRLNSYPQFRVLIDGHLLHFVHCRGRAGSNPIVLLHGWPGSFVQMLDLIPLLTHPADHGGEADDALDVVIVSLPGFGFSSRPPRVGMNEARMADLIHQLMTATLGYRRYAVRGSDFGGTVATHLTDRYPAAVIGTHSGGTSPRVDATLPDLSPAEQQYARAVQQWRSTEVGYGAIHGTKPQTLATALNDSPAGLASWIVEKYRRWSDCDGDVERRFSKDQLLTNVMVYWLSETIGSSSRLYRDGIGDANLVSSTVPAAFLMSSKDMFPTPRDWVARTARIDRWTEIDKGGHFIEQEEPELVAADIHAFLRSLGARVSQPR